MPAFPSLSPELASASDDPSSALAAPEPARRKRLKPGERRGQILQALAAMLEQPDAERITTAALASRLGVSEAALYRHFASKAQMFEGLIALIEESVLTRVQQLVQQEADPVARSRKLVKAVLAFAEKNPGMARVMAGDALVFEHERLQARMNQFFDSLEASLTRSLHDAAMPALDAPLRAGVAVDFMLGRLQRFARSGFKRLPLQQLDASLAMILA
ncbi:MAG: nucleoid occlusion factor SlmA [Pseudomonadota bacterium]|nr:nucleoid occlusion factor SlmA [Pseudomonadota bacterium]